MVTQVSRLEEHSFNDAAWDGLEQAKDAGTANWIASIETVDPRDYSVNIRVFVEAGYDAVVTVGDEVKLATYEAATKYPEVYFIGVDQHRTESMEPITNLAWLIFPEDDIGYLAGAFASLMSQTGKIGAVCASDAWTPIQQCCEGFRAGALHFNPEMEVTVIYHNEVDIDSSFTDPEWGTATAAGIIEDGVDVVFGVGGTTADNAITAAAVMGAYGIGAYVDQYDFLPVASSHLLTSVLKVISPAIRDLLRAASEAQAQIGAFPAGDYYGTIGLAPYHELELLVPDQVSRRINALLQELSSGLAENAEPTPTLTP